MMDKATKLKEKLYFPRVFVNVSIDEELPAVTQFEDEMNGIVEVRIGYEWKPDRCKHCQCMGHKFEECRKQKPRNYQWIVKKEEEKKILTEKMKDPDDFQLVTKGVKHKEKNKENHKGTILTNAL
ncbi:unnamed protein product [Vicia faba]|uniref:Zinc knuckle CX2CX4HX4C domain-containing protein n=1 Tax=Vicia faba TaxID=3906 RepID=A0AAV0ZC27_VICFA|nr:unnamed protein product [Vicia faba]